MTTTRYTSEPFVVCAAVILDTGETVAMPRPNRHHNLIALFPGRVKHQGFLLSDGSYANRTIAYIAAKNTSQLGRLTKREGILFTEDLW
jgi:hypothetical protein